MFSSFSEIRSALADGSTTVRQIVQHYLDNISAKEHLNAFLEVYADECLAQADVLDQKIKDGTAGRLAGMVLALKDNLCQKGKVVSASSKILESFESVYTATAVQRLINEDIIIIGRTNCDEFAMGSSNENSAFGNVLNPVNEKTVPGGSSGGSAAAVKANMCTASLGTDTGGSIRQPASFCGVVGMKPTYGRISRYGLLAYASSFDQIGPFTTTIEDAALLTEIMAGADDFDSTVAQNKVDSYSKELQFDGKAKIGYIAECLDNEGVDPEVRERLNTIIEGLKAEGHTVEPVSFPYLDYMVPTYYVLTTAEASSNLSRYDGMRYGHRSAEATTIDSTYFKSRSEGFGIEVQRRIMLGTFVLSAGYYDAYYGKGQKVRRLLHDKTNELFKSYDFLLTPTTPDVAFEHGQNSEDPIKMYLQDIFTVQANLAGIPAISLPLGEQAGGMPFGVQLMAGAFDEARMFAFSKTLMEQFG